MKDINLMNKRLFRLYRSPYEFNTLIQYGNGPFPFLFKYRLIKINKEFSDFDIHLRARDGLNH